MAKFGLSWNLPMQKSFQRLPRRPLKTASNGKTSKNKSYCNFSANHSRHKIHPKRTPEAHGPAQLLRSLEAVSGTQKIMTWLTPTPTIYEDFGQATILWDHKGHRWVLEKFYRFPGALGSKGHPSHGLDCISTSIYIEWNPTFGAPIHCDKNPPCW
jgi:hypothetical protein